jgi:uncharacterized protein YbaR (Trm112 family)
VSEIKPIGFACLKCKRPLQSVENALQCGKCRLAYPIVGGIPDFLSQASLAPDTRRILFAKGMGHERASN